MRREKVAGQQNLNGNLLANLPIIVANLSTQRTMAGF
jgi:hypothetical protein